MSNRHTFWSIFIVAALSLASLLYSVHQFNTELEASRQTNVKLEKQLEEVKSYDLSLKNDINVLKNRIKNLLLADFITSDPKRETTIFFAPASEATNPQNE